MMNGTVMMDDDEDEDEESTPVPRSKRGVARCVFLFYFILYLRKFLPRITYTLIIKTTTSKPAPVKTNPRKKRH